MRYVHLVRLPSRLLLITFIVWCKQNRSPQRRWRFHSCHSRKQARIRAALGTIQTILVNQGPDWTFISWILRDHPQGSHNHSMCRLQVKLIFYWSLFFQFNEQELELLISGTPDIDVDEWRAATEYNGYTSSDPNIVWWWRALKSFNRDERAKVLSFATGTSRVPLNGFMDLQGVQGVQKFSIHRAYGESDRLPQAHTCKSCLSWPF